MKRTAALVAIVAGVVIGSKLLLENVLGIDLEPWARSWVTGAGPAGAFTVVALLAADVVLPIPSSLVMILSGAAFGVWWGSLLAFAGSLGGEWLGFELARRYGSAWSDRFIGDPAEVRRLNRLLEQHGAAAIAISRALPVVMETLSLMAGVSSMKRRTFLGASALGTAPIVVAYAYSGALSRETGTLVPALVMLVAVTIAGAAWYRSRVSRSELSSAASPD